MIRFISLLFLVGSSFVVKSQESTLGSWNIINMKIPVRKNWSIFGESQLRSLSFYQQFHYYEFKAGISFVPLKNLSLTIGAGTYQTYAEGGNFKLPKNNNEFRCWPQLVLLQSIGKIRVEQRYRAELRFTSNGYRNRFRYRLGISYPIINDKQKRPLLQLIASNEIFFTNREPYFERNRAMIGFQKKINEMCALQFGYLHQFDYKINDETGRDFLQIGCYFDLKSKCVQVASSESDLKEN
jgi:hypothetical protein